MDGANRVAELLLVLLLLLLRLLLLLFVLCLCCVLLLCPCFLFCVEDKLRHMYMGASWGTGAGAAWGKGELCSPVYTSKMA